MCQNILLPLNCIHWKHYSLKIGSNPANICWSWRRLQHVFSITIFCLPRCLEDVLQMRPSWRCLEDVLKTSRKMSRRRLEYMSWRRLEDMSSRHLEGVFETNKIFTGISVNNHDLLTNLNQYLTNLYLTKLYFTNLRRIQNA